MLWLSPPPSTHLHFPPKTHQLPCYTHTAQSVHTNLFAVLCLIPSILPPSLPSSLHPRLPLSLSLPCGCFSVLSLPFMQNYSPFPTNLRGNASNFPIVLLLKHYHKSLFSLMEKKALLFFSGNLCDIWEKKTNITDSYRERGVRVRGKSWVSQLKATLISVCVCMPVIMCVWLCVCVLKYWICISNCVLLWSQ